jgi:Uma2 family endonuclease
MNLAAILLRKRRGVKARLCVLYVCQRKLGYDKLMAALPDLITVTQFRQLPYKDAYRYELRHGEVVAVTRPKARHWRLQVRLTRLLEPKLKGFGEVGMELPFRPLPEFELMAADVAAVSRRRFEAIDPDDNLHGAPELVIEIKSPSNTPGYLRERAAVCLAKGALQFWVVDEDKKSVTAIHQDGSVIVYQMGDAIPLGAFGSDELAVARIFR